MCVTPAKKCKIQLTRGGMVVKFSSRGGGGQSLEKFRQISWRHREYAVLEQRAYNQKIAQR